MTENIYSSVEQTVPHLPPVIVQDVAAGSVLFSDLAQTVLFPHAVPLSQMVGSTGLVMTATPADGVWAQLVASNVRGLTTNLADANTKTATGLLQYQLPENYVPGALISVRLTVALVAVTDTIASNNGSNIDLECYAQSRSLGTVGSDLNGTSAQTDFAALATKYAKTFVIDPTNRVPGDVLNLKVVGQAIEAGAEGGTIQMVLYTVEVLCTVYGAAS